MCPSKITNLVLASVSCFLLGTNVKANADPSILTDGNYLYGEVAKPYQIGKDYLLLKVKSGQVSGAVYRPNADFYCFRGIVKGEQLELSFVDPNNGTVYAQEIGIRSITGPIASEKIPQNKISLNGFEPIEQLSEVDHEILNACSSNSTR